MTARRPATLFASAAAALSIASAAAAQAPPDPDAGPRWIAAGAPTAQARAVLSILRDVADRGLDPLEFGVDELSRAALLLDVSTDSTRLQRFDRMLTRAVVRLLAELHRGRVDPRALRFDLPESHRGLDLDAMAAAVSRAADPGAVIDAAEPPYAGYRLLKDALALYRAFGPDSARRVRQIELTLERWRWLPDTAPPRFLVVNVPAFRLFAFEDDPAAARPVLALDVIVGRAAGRHATPLFTGTMRELVFLPYWEVPPRIARKELVPQIRRDPGYFAREGFEIVAAGGDRAYPRTAATLERVAAGTLRLRQRPGARNALGPVKFVFPNEYDVYLHGTPAQQLFAAERRDFSHGCIRVEDPAALAAFVLGGDGGWTRAAVDEAMAGDRTRRVPVARPVEVFVLYATAVAHADGSVSFYRDLYRHDAALARALRASRGGGRGVGVSATAAARR